MKNKDVKIGLIWDLLIQINSAWLYSDALIMHFCHSLSGGSNYSCNYNLITSALLPVNANQQLQSVMTRVFFYYEMLQLLRQPVNKQFSSFGFF